MKTHILAATGAAFIAFLPTPAAAEALSGYVSGYPSQAAACNGARSNARTDAVGIDHEVESYSSCQCSETSRGWACEVVAHTRPRVSRYDDRASAPPRYNPPRRYTPPPRRVNPVLPPPDVYSRGNQ